MMNKAKRYSLIFSASLVLAFGASAQLSGPGGGFKRPASTQSQGAAGQPSQANRALPPTPPSTDSPGMSIFLDYAVIVLLGGAVIAVSLIPGKRGHQD